MYRGVLSSGLGSIGVGSHGEFVPHVGVTVTLGLMVADLAVLIYFIHHTAVSIQLPQVIASIAADLTEAIRQQGTGNPEPHQRADLLKSLSRPCRKRRRRVRGTDAGTPARRPGK